MADHVAEDVQRSVSRANAAQIIAPVLEAIENLSILERPELLRSLSLFNGRWFGVEEADQRSAMVSVADALRDRDLVTSFSVGSDVEQWANRLDEVSTWPYSAKVFGQLGELAAIRRQEGDTHDSLVLRLGVIEDSRSVNEEFIFGRLVSELTERRLPAAVTPGRLVEIAEIVLEDPRFRIQKLSAPMQVDFAIQMTATDEHGVSSVFPPPDLETQAKLEHVCELIEDQARAYLGFEISPVTIPYGLYGTRTVNRATYNEDRMRRGDPARRARVAGWLGTRAFERGDLQSFMAFGRIIADTHMAFADILVRRVHQSIQHGVAMDLEEASDLMRQSSDHLKQAATMYQYLVRSELTSSVPIDVQRYAHAQLRLIHLELGRRSIAIGDLKEASQHFTRADWHMVPGTAPLGAPDSNRGILEQWGVDPESLLNRAVIFDQERFFGRPKPGATTAPPNAPA